MNARGPAGLSISRPTIRPATRADLKTMLDFRMAMLAAVFPGQPDRPTDHLREANERWMVDHLERDFAGWIAEVDGRPLACAGMMWFPHPPGPVSPGGTEAYILNVYTRPEARRRGLARALMERAVEAAREAGVTRIWLRASTEGRPLYEAMGFRGGNYLQLVPQEMEAVVGLDEGGAR